MKCVWGWSPYRTSVRWVIDIFTHSLLQRFKFLINTFTPAGERSPSHLSSTPLTLHRLRDWVWILLRLVQSPPGGWWMDEGLSVQFPSEAALLNESIVVWSLSVCVIELWPLPLLHSNKQPPLFLLEKSSWPFSVSSGPDPLPVVLTTVSPPSSFSSSTSFIHVWKWKTVVGRQAAVTTASLALQGVYFPFSLIGLSVWPSHLQPSGKQLFGYHF